MTQARPRPLRHVLEMHRDEWDRDDTRPAVREAFAKVLDCRYRGPRRRGLRL